MTHREFAELLGVERSRFSHWVASRNATSPRDLESVAKRLGMTIGELYSFEATREELRKVGLLARKRPG
jgi:transcriptional regulator with XRE-family HTH domain